MSEKVVYDDGRMSIIEIADTPWGVPFSYISSTHRVNLDVPGAAVLPVTKDGHVVLVHQHRPALNWEHTTEIPRGGAEIGETGQQCAVRELYEETGLIARDVVHLGDMEPDNGMISARIPVFFARVDDVDVSFVSDETTVSIVTMEEFEEAIRTGKIRDSFTCYAAYLAKLNNLI